MTLVAILLWIIYVLTGICFLGKWYRDRIWPLLLYCWEWYMYSRVFVLLADGTEIEYDPCCYIAVNDICTHVYLFSWQMVQRENMTIVAILLWMIYVLTCICSLGRWHRDRIWHLLLYCCGWYMYSRGFILLADGTEIEYDPCCYIAVYDICTHVDLFSWQMVQR